KPWTGVFVLTGSANYKASVPGTPTGGNLALGDSVVVYGAMQEFPNPRGETEIEGPDGIPTTRDILIRRISSGLALPAAHVATTAELNWLPAISAATPELWEGCLVRINGPLKVARNVSAAGINPSMFLIVDNPSFSGDSVLIDGLTLASPTFSVPALNTPIDFVQGIVNQRTSTASTGSVNSYRIQLRDANDIAFAVPPNLLDAYS